MSENDNEKRMTFTEHLGELRTRIIRSGICVVVMVVLCYAFSNGILKMIARPLTAIEVQQVQPADPNAPEPAPAPVPAPQTNVAMWTLLSPFEIVIVKFKIAGYGGLVLSSPFLIWQLLAFIFPGLKPGEKRVVQILVFGCGTLALIGVLVAYFGVLPMLMPWIMGWIPEGWTQQVRASETLTFLFKFMAGFAIAFQFPMVVLILVYLGLLTPQTLKQYRKVAIVGLTIGAAVLTPPDPVSMIIMLLPLVIMYEGSILLSYLVIRRKKQTAAADA
jgi:sec-independent protein translocase protein TatC